MTLKIKQFKMKCQHCNKNLKEKDIDLHLIHPKFMDNKKGDGIKSNLCESCHIILHQKIPSLYWHILTNGQKREAIEIVKKYGKKYGGLK